MAINAGPIQKFYGSSTDQKPEPTNISKGSEYFELDTKNTYINDGSSWNRFPFQYGSEKHPVVNIAIAGSSTTFYVSSLWNKPGRTLTNFLTTTPDSTGAAVTFAIGVYSSGSTGTVLFYSTVIAESLSVYLPFSTNSQNVVIDEGVYFGVTLSAQNETTNRNVTVIPYSRG